MSDLPYRPNVGAVLFNADGLVLVARRADQPHGEAAAGAWQLPQGGLDEGEEPRQAEALRLPANRVPPLQRGRVEHHPRDGQR